MLPPTRWRWWAPTPGEEVAVLPPVSTGGAAAIEAGSRVASPWQPVQEPAPPESWTMPSMCSPPATLMVPFGFTVPAWQLTHAVTAPTGGWGAAGGRPWQVPQAAWVPSTLFQTGVLRKPPAVAAPWQ